MDRDAEGVAAAGSGHIEAFYRAHASSVYALLVTLCRDRAWAEDLMQETFVKATRSIAGYRGGSPRAWLFAVARTTFLDASRRRRPVVPMADAPQAGFEDPDVVEDLAVRQVLDRLPVDHRTALVLRDQLGLGYDEVGAALGGRSPGAARVLVHRARAAFRTRWAEQEARDGA